MIAKIRLLVVVFTSTFLFAFIFISSYCIVLKICGTFPFFHSIMTNIYVKVKVRNCSIICNQ